MTDVEPRAPYPGSPADPDKEGGFKDDRARPAPADDDTGHVDVETGEDARDDEGGMIGEG